MSNLVKCKGGCGKYVALGRFDELCIDCWRKRKLQASAIPSQKTYGLETKEGHWNKGQTMCIFCFEQVYTIRAFKLHIHMTNHFEMWDKLTDKEREEKTKERERRLLLDSYDGAEKTATF
jgi:hypothetical protein